MRLQQNEVCRDTHHQVRNSFRRVALTRFNHLSGSCRVTRANFAFFLFANSDQTFNLYCTSSRIDRDTGSPMGTFNSQASAEATLTAHALFILRVTIFFQNGISATRCQRHSSHVRILFVTRLFLHDTSLSAYYLRYARGQGGVRRNQQ